MLLAAISLVLLLVLAGVLYQYLGEQSDARRFPAPGRLIDLGTHRLHLYKSGEGGPAVILESGISASSLNWRTVQNAVSGFTTVCSYDRAGLGWSDLSDTPCTPAALAAQLHSLLERAGISAPYILVGHSFGALIVRSFAEQHPQLTAGVVLVDPLDPAEWSAMIAEQQATIAHGVRLSRRGAMAARLGVVRLCLDLLLSGNRLLPRAAAKLWSGKASPVTDRIAGQVRKMPPETWPQVAAHWKQAKSFEGMARHFECLPASLREMQQVTPLQAPVTMLVGTTNEHPADPVAYAHQLSPTPKIIHAQQSGHWIQLDEPQLVVDAIRDLVERTRTVRNPVAASSERVAASSDRNELL